MWLLILGFAGVATGVIDLQAIGGRPPAPIVGFNCPDTKATNIDVRVRNVINSSEDFNVGTPTSVVFRQLAGGGTKEQTRAATTGATALTQTVDCGELYDVVILSVNSATGAGVNSVGIKNVRAEGRSVQKDIEAYQIGYPNCKITNSIFANLTTSTGAAQSQGFSPCGGGATFTTTDAETFDAGTANTYHVQFQTNTSGALGSFGSNDPEVKTYLCADFNTGVFSLANGVVFPALAATSTVPSGAPANDGFDKCWVINPIKSNEPLRDYELSVSADLGVNPAATDDITFRLYDEQRYVGSDGKPKIGTVDDTAANLGAVNVGVQITMA